jgi:hypothetical protein
LYDDLNNHGIHQRKTYEQITNIFEFIPQQLLNHFIRGVFDGDGCISSNSNNTISCKFDICGTNDILEKIQKVLMENIDNLSKTKIIDLKNNNANDLVYGGRNNIKNIFNWLYNNANIYLERKYNKFIEILTEDFTDRTQSHYIGVAKKYKTRWISQITIGKKKKYIKLCKSELEAAYYHDLEEVRQRGEEAKRFMNFPSKYDDFVQWVNEGY